MTTFLLRAPSALFSSCTQGQALKAVAWLKRDLGVKQEYLFPRIVCAAPGVLLQVCVGVTKVWGRTLKGVGLAGLKVWMAAVNAQVALAQHHAAVLTLQHRASLPAVPLHTHNTLDTGH